MKNLVTDEMVEEFENFWIKWSLEGDNIEAMELSAIPDLKTLLIGALKLCQS